MKKDAETGNNIPYAGTGFHIYDPDGKLVHITFTYPKVTTLQLATYESQTMGQFFNHLANNNIPTNTPHETSIKRSMSRVGTPTYNPIKRYVLYFNNERLSYKLHYKTPVQYRIEQGFS